MSNIKFYIKTDELVNAILYRKKEDGIFVFRQEKAPQKVDNLG